MKVIANTGNGGFLLEATGQELKHILNAVHGVGIVGEIKIGQKVPAIDYASTITKIKDLRTTYEYEQLIGYTKRVGEVVRDFDKVVVSASEMFDEKENVK